MDIVYVLIGFVCGFLCDASIHFMKWKKQHNQKSKIRKDMERMTLAEVKEMCKHVSAEIIREKKEMDNESD